MGEPVPKGVCIRAVDAFGELPMGPGVCGIALPKVATLCVLRESPPNFGEAATAPTDGQGGIERIIGHDDALYLVPTSPTKSG